MGDLSPSIYIYLGRRLPFIEAKGKTYEENRIYLFADCHVWQVLVASSHDLIATK
jgi:hypothetical protein